MKVVKKGTNRPAAEAKKKKHAQGTPLPKKSARAEATKDVKWKASARSVVKEAKEKGWKVKTEEVESGVTLAITRGTEEITAVWRDGRLIGKEVVYVSGGRKVTLRNLKAIGRTLDKSEEDAASANRTAASNRRNPRRRSQAQREEGAGEVVIPDTERRKMLPFDPDTATADEIIDGVRGRTLVWRSRMNGQLLSATVMEKPNQKYLKVKNNPFGEPYVEFFSANGGMYSVSLDRLIEVS